MYKNSAIWRINNDELPWHVLQEDNSQIQTLPNTVALPFKTFPNRLGFKFHRNLF